MHFLLKYIIPLNVIFDIFLLIFQRGGFFPLMRGGVMFIIVIYFFLSKPKNVWIYYNLIIFSVYVLVNVIFSSEFLPSLSQSIKILISMLFFIVGLEYFGKLNRFMQLHKSVLIAYFLIFINIVVSNIYNLGEIQYGGDDSFMAGNLSDNWNLLTYTLMLFPMIYSQYPKTIIPKNLSLILFFVLVIFVLLSMKRTAIAGLVIGLLIYGYHNLKFKSFLRVIIVSGIFLGASYPLYAPILEKRFEARSDRFEEGALEEEGRYLESFFVWEEIYAFKDPAKQLLGLEAFNSRGNYANGFFGDRILHVDYNAIVNTIGLVGLLLYFLIFYQIFRRFKRFYNKISSLSIPFKKEIKGTFYALLITQFVTSFGGQMYAVTFRMIIFIYLGAIIGLLRNYSITSKTSLKE